VEEIDYISFIHCYKRQLSVSYQLFSIKLDHCGSKTEMYIPRDAALSPSIQIVFRGPNFC